MKSGTTTLAFIAQFGEGGEGLKIRLLAGVSVRRLCLLRRQRSSGGSAFCVCPCYKTSRGMSGNAKGMMSCPLTSGHFPGQKQRKTSFVENGF